MRPEVEARQNRFEVRRTQLTGSTRRLAARRQADDRTARQIVVNGISHRFECIAGAFVYSTSAKDSD
jgi:hypothetical protein